MRASRTLPIDDDADGDSCQHPRDDFSVLALTLQLTPDTMSQQVHICVHESWEPTEQPLFLHLDRHNHVKRTSSSHVDCLPEPPYGVFTLHEPIPLFHASSTSLLTRMPGNDKDGNRQHSSSSLAETIDADDRSVTRPTTTSIQTRPKAAWRPWRAWKQRPGFFGMLCGSVIGVIASLAVAAAVVPAIQPVLPIQLPILLLMQRLDPPSLALTPPTVPHFSSFESQLVNQASHNLRLFCKTARKPTSTMPCKAVQSKLSQVRQAVQDVPHLVDTCIWDVARQGERLVATLRELDTSPMPYYRIRHHLARSRAAPQAYIQHLLPKPDPTSEKGKGDRDNINGKGKGKKKHVKRLRNPLVEQEEEEVNRGADTFENPRGILPAIATTHSQLAELERLLCAVLADVDLLWAADDNKHRSRTDDDDPPRRRQQEASDQLRQVLTVISARRVRLELALKGTEALVQTLEDMTGTGTGGKRTNAGNGIGSDVFWSAVWRWAGLTDQEASRSPTASVLAFSTSATKAASRQPRHATIPRFLISATRRAWGEVALPPLQAQSVAISTAVINLNLGLKKLREQQWAEARSKEAEEDLRRDDARLRLADIFAQLDKSSCWRTGWSLWSDQSSWSSSLLPPVELNDASPPREWARRFACTWRRLNPELRTRVRDKVRTAGRLWIVLLQVERLGPEQAELY